MRPDHETPTPQAAAAHARLTEPYYDERLDRYEPDPTGPSTRTQLDADVWARIRAASDAAERLIYRQTGRAS